MAVTIRDVAALAGVSPATVSRTCNNNPAITAETKEKVWQAIAALGYQVPNTAGNTGKNTKDKEVDTAEVSPAESATKRPIYATNYATNAIPISASAEAPLGIGIVMHPQEKNGFDNPFVTRALRGICQTAMARSCSTALISGENHAQMLSYMQWLLAQKRVQGFVFLYSDRNDPLIEYMHKAHIPFVVIGKASTHINDTLYVDNDNLAAGQDAASYLIGLGHRKIAFVCDDMARIFAYERHAGFRLAMLQNGLDIPEEYTLSGITMPLDNTSPLAHLLQSPDRPTALIMVDDTVALAALQLCHEMDIRIPEDMSIITFNNSVMVKLSNPPLTNIDVNSRQLGMEAASQLINLLQNPTASPTKIIVPHYLVERQSCAVPKA